VLRTQVLPRSAGFARVRQETSHITLLILVLCLMAFPAIGQTPQNGTSSAAVSGPAIAQGTDRGSSAVSKPVFHDTWKIGSKLGTDKKKSEKYDVSKIGERKIGGGINFYSIEKEVALGKELSAEIERTAKLVRDPVITEYVNRIGQQIVRNSDAKVPFTIKVVDDDQVNAFALPGGFFYVNTGLLLAADNEAELAGVMAHEIAHVAARHATKNATKGQIWNLASIPLIFLGGPAGLAIREVAGIAVPMSFLKFGRDAEREADLLGIEYEYASGYDPAAFVQFFEKLKAQEKQKKNFLAKAFSTHPMTEDRIERAQNEIQTLLPAREQYVVDTSEFEAVKARVAALENRSRIDEDGAVRPTLRRRDRPSDKQDSGSDNKDNGRPTLRRRTD
jgi:predicted Zn-dependent protease